MRHILYVKIGEEFAHLILQDRFCAVHIPFDRMVKFQFLIQFPVDHLDLYYYYNDHHHHVVRLARISQTLFLHVSLSFIPYGRCSGLHPVSSHSWCMYVRAGRPAFDWRYAGVHRSTSLTISSLLLQQCPAFIRSERWNISNCNKW